MLARTTGRLLAAAICIFFKGTAAVGATVDTRCNQYTGVVGTDGVTKWLGIRYAQAPLGDLRFAPPEAPRCHGGNFSARTGGPICLATGADPTDSSTSEDCLFMDIYAPSHATATSKLPVYLYFPGGGFNSNANPMMNGEGLVKASDGSIIFVTINYRVGPWGFLTDGDKITANNGLRDQRQALKWIQQYISYFGGDPGHVVLGGNSAGAASVSLQMTAFGGVDSGLFHAGAAESISFGPVLTVAEAQYQFNNLSARAGCDGTHPLACLRSKTAEELQEVNTNIPYPGGVDAPLYQFSPTIDGDFVRELTYTAFAKGNYVKIPLIVGDDTNEGTTFTPRDTSTLAESDAFLVAQFPALTTSQLKHINFLYPNPNETNCPNLGCYWRQVSNAYGDMRYTCPGQYVSTVVSRSGPPVYNYHYDVRDPDQVAEGLGVPHTVETNAIFGADYSSGPPASYYAGGINAAVTPVIRGYWISFIRTFNPNTYRERGSARWDEWDPHVQGRLLFETGGGTKLEYVPAIQREQCAYFQSIGPHVQQK